MQNEILKNKMHKRNEIEIFGANSIICTSTKWSLGSSGTCKQANASIALREPQAVVSLIVASDAPVEWSQLDPVYAYS